MSDTFVTKLDEAGGRRLYDALGQGAFAFRPVPHAHWAAQGEETSVTFYRSGKLVVQGKGAQAFMDRYLGGGAPNEPKTRETVDPKRDEIGSDESGKGDYFGPLVVAAALVRQEDLELLASLGVQDSKAATDSRIRLVEGRLLEALPSAVRVLDPETYNAAWAETGNLNRLLGHLHAEVLGEVVASGVPEDARIVVDRFGDPQLVRGRMDDATRRHPFIMPTRGESHPAVAAASFLARAAFLRGFEELKGLAGGELYRGASDPRILPLARRLYREGGRAWLGRFAKLHFKVTDRVCA